MSGYSVSAVNLFGKRTDLSEFTINQIVQKALTVGAENPLHRSLSEIAGGALSFKGSWVVNTNPVLVNGDPAYISGDVFIATSTGLFNGHTIGPLDWVIYNGLVWVWFDSPDIEAVIPTDNNPLKYLDGTKTFKQVDYVGLTSKPLLGTVAQYDTGGLTGQIPRLSNNLVVSDVMIAGANGTLFSTTVNNAFNKTFGFGANNVAEGLATQTALNTKEPTIPTGVATQYIRGNKTLNTLDKIAVGLPNVDNTTDANKPISIATQNALNLKAVIDDANSTTNTTYSSSKINTLVQTLTSGLTFIGTWNASTNTPTLINS
jgi:hypothetical protein